MLKGLYLTSTQITDAGCATLAAALDRGALPALEALRLHGIPASDASKAAVREALRTGSLNRESRPSGLTVIFTYSRCGLVVGL